MKILMKMKHGSHLYGTNTIKSDTDYKGIYLPSLEDYLLQKIQKTITNNTNNHHSKNTNTDIDDQLFSLNYFIQLCINGDTYAIDTLHAPQGWEEITSDVWEDLKAKRHLFYSKNLKSYIGYCKGQAAKYSIKGSRLDTAKKIVEWCEKTIEESKKIPADMTFQAYLKHIHFHNTNAIPENVPTIYKSYQEAIANGNSNVKGTKIIFHLQNIPNLEYTKTYLFYNEDNSLDLQKSYYEIFDKKFHLSDYIESIYKSLSHFCKEFGERAELARQNQNIDWKAIHHAFRAGYQLQEIYETQNLIYPLQEKEFLLKIKQGKFHYIDDKINVKLEELIEKVQDLSKNSTFPEKCDAKYWDNWLFNILKSKLFCN